MDNACLIAFFAGLVGARLFHLLEYPREFLADPMAMLLSRGGFTILRRPHRRAFSPAWLLPQEARTACAGAGRGRASDDAGVRHRPHRLPDLGRR